MAQLSRILVRNKMEEVKLIPNVEFIESLASDQHKYVQDDGMVEIVYEQKTRESKKNINSNLHVINVILVLFGIMSIVFIVSRAPRYLSLFAFHILSCLDV